MKSITEVVRMTNPIKPRAFFYSLAVCVILLSANAATAQTSRLHIDYMVEVADVDAHLFHVTADIKNIAQPQLDLSLPTWTPGWYVIENYAKNMLRFQISDARGMRMPHHMIRKQTWRVNTRGIAHIRVEFDYRATVLALNQAKITEDFAFFTGIQLFLMAEGHRNAPSSVRFKVPEGWKVLSALKETPDPYTFTAPDYDTLVDAPTQMGKFDVAAFEVDGKKHYFASTPVGAFSEEKSRQFTEKFSRVVLAQKAVFGELPYDKYILFYFFARPESNASGALEHLNSYVAFAPAGGYTTPEMLLGTAAHEFFHVWNVKRIRPAGMWPYDYSRENETPLLWVSEGITNYYTSLSLYRAGLSSSERFLQSVTGAINGVENNKARNYISPADASTSTWLGYDTPVAFGISYYTQGQNLGALLDLSIRHDTGGAKSLDDVMRALYRDFYLKGKGFSTEDMMAIIKRLTGRDYKDFYSDYVWGVKVPPYETIFGYAGYSLINGGAGERKNYRVVEVAEPDAKQLKIRESWLKREP